MPRKFRSNQYQLPAPNGSFVYCYLRTNSNKPYYIGQGSRADRLTARHSCKVPADRSRIRIMRESLDQAGADYWESFYINRYGLKQDGGILVNRREGGLHGGVLDEALKQQISEKVIALHAEGVFDTLNAPETVARRVTQRMINQAEALGLTLEQYQMLTKSQRDYAKRWLKKNPNSSYADFLVSGKAAKAAAKYKVPLVVWEELTHKQRNAVKEYCNRAPERSGMDYLNGHRATRGSKRRVDSAKVFELRAQGLKHKAIAEIVGCTQPHVTRILNGKAQTALRTQLLPA